MPNKDPQARLDYGWNWAEWLAEGETIETSTWTISTITGDAAPLELDVANGGATHDDTTTTVWLKGGTLGKRYTAVNHIATSQGREDDRTLPLDIKNR